MHAAPQPGAGLPALDKPRFTPAHIVRWMAAQQNWDRLHFDQAFCREVAGLPGPVINGALKQHLIIQFLQRALPGAWPWRVDFQFLAPDFVGEKLQVQGSCVAREGAFATIELHILNLDRNEITTRGRATVVCSDEGPLLDALAIDAPAALALSTQSSPPDAHLPAAIKALLGTELDRRASTYPVDLSRLRLFADAVMDLDPVHHDPQAPSPWGGVVAPPLFPLHGLEAPPGSYPLSEAHDAQGREGVNEVGRDLAGLLGIADAVGMNAGNKVQVHSLARVGERIQVRSLLVGVKSRTSARGGRMTFVESLNHYSETGGRPLVSERQTTVFRHASR